jgi:hypothetical protein
VGQLVLEGAVKREVARQIVGPVTSEAPAPFLPKGTAKLLDQLGPAVGRDVVDL